MNKELIENTLKDALHFLNSEIQGISLDYLKEEYSQIINKLEEAIAEIEKPVNGKA